MYRLLLYILVAPFLVATTFGQGTIRGTVTDAETGEGLPGVNVIVIGTAAGAATDFDGNYAIPGLRPGQYNVQASFIGY